MNVNEGLTSIAGGLDCTPDSGRAATTATLQIVWNMSYAGVRAISVPCSSRFDCSQMIFLPVLRSEKVTLAATPPWANVRPTMKTCGAILAKEFGPIQGPHLPFRRSETARRNPVQEYRVWL